MKKLLKKNIKINNYIKLHENVYKITNPTDLENIAVVVVISTPSSPEYTEYFSYGYLELKGAEILTVAESPEYFL